MRLSSRFLFLLITRFQSTHPRRVRQRPQSWVFTCQMFQSTHPRRVRLLVHILLLSQLKFQSTHPRRVRRGKTITCTATGGFNPRTHVGCDQLAKVEDTAEGSFNPRTHVGCDLQGFGDYQPCEFQSTHPRRVRRAIIWFKDILANVSIHAPT